MLTLHLKRFQQDLSGRLRKINGPVPLPQELDISPFCDAEVLLYPSACFKFCTAISKPLL